MAPADGGWLHGQPGDGVFRPYVVLVSSGASPRYQDLSTTWPGWTVSFSLRSFAGSRRQCDWMGMLVRSAAQGFNHTSFGESEAWKVIGVEWSGLGPVSRVDATNPPFWQVFDSVSFVCGT